MFRSLLLHDSHVYKIAMIAIAVGAIGCQEPRETEPLSPSQTESQQTATHNSQAQRRPDELDELSQDLSPQTLQLLREHFPDYTLPLSTPRDKQVPPPVQMESQPYIEVSAKPLAEAVINGEVERTRRLLRSGHPADETYYGENLLHVAAKRGQTEICELLLDAGLDVHGSSDEEPNPAQTPLQAAILSGSIETAELLLAHGAELTPTSANNKRDGPAPLPVSLAISSGNLDMLNFIIDQGEAADQFAFLHQAIMQVVVPEQRRKFVQRLFAAGAAEDIKPDSPELFAHAIATGDAELVQILEEKLPVDYGESHLRAAVQSGDQDLCRYLLSKGVRAKPDPAVGNELLRIALIDHRSPELAELVVEAGERKKYCVQSDAATSYCNLRDFAHPLYHTAMANDLNLCRYLIREFSDDPNLWGSLIYEPYEYESGIKFFQKDNTILFAAVFDDNVEALKLLLRYTQRPGQQPIVDINAQNGVGHTVLHEAVNFGAPRCVQVLLAAGADPTIARNDGCTPLHIAMQRHLLPHHHSDTPMPEAMSKIFPMLAAATMSHGDENWVNRTNENDETILHRHARAAHPSICQKLIELNADVNAVDHRGQTALHHAIDGTFEYQKPDDKERHIATCVTLLNNGIDITQADASAHQNYVRCAAAKNLYEVYDALLEKDAKPDLAQNAGSLMGSAAKFGKPERIKQLLNWGADVNSRDSEDSTALHQAARFHHLEVCELLIANGADVNATDQRGQTPLFELFDRWAIHPEHLQNEETQTKAFAVLTLLLEHGADPEIKTNSTTYTSFSGTVVEIYKNMPQSFRQALQTISTTSF
ncbi:ankyrin repeat protein [Rhodopirellula maiorica SM1]|uniref:Ankyrin repeat protein n=1 Tax=Rhodopirellula maiorica SM1 TaxID=1265738 RepID=M5RRX9_9BACT|nr:ankyrin repeat domain-containing protein [Rhodopirellula maiorica]EMI16714.1 ankyrin repeat protein [Rhodopirellula maiorica SM1]